MLQGFKAPGVFCFTRLGREYRLASPSPSRGSPRRRSRLGRQKRIDQVRFYCYFLYNNAQPTGGVSMSKLANYFTKADRKKLFFDYL
jgi:hypothetical protein